MRGTRNQIMLQDVVYGITPAYAGNTVLGYIPANNIKDHPRLCGEHSNLQGSHIIDVGSPPLMRGTQRPSRAGPGIRKDHPRLCGEHPYQLSQHFRYLGSPPLMRGTLTRIVFLLLISRITPAYAGNTGRGIGI